MSKVLQVIDPLFMVNKKYIFYIKFLIKFKLKVYLKKEELMMPFI
jgi:hypothetical protein